MTRRQTTFLAIFAGLALSAGAAVPGAEKLLPDDTLVLVTAPDFVKLRETYKKSPPARLWDDPALKTFREKFVSRFQEEFVKPLERELDVKLDNYTSLPRGQVTFAVTQNGWQGDKDQPLGFLLLLDTGDKSEQLKKNLAELRKRWVDDGKPIRSEKIRGFEFSVLSMSSNDVPKTLRKFFPPASEVQELGADNDTKKAGVKSELVLGQAESLLILGNSLKVVEKVVIRLTGGAMPALGELAAYQANHLALFREAPLYAWVNTKTFIETWSRKAAEKKDNPQAPNPFDLNPLKIINATGLSGLKTVAVSFQDSNDGGLFQLFLGVPEANRQGLFKLLVGEAKEHTPPAFVPADVVKFQRFRLDGQKAWGTLEKMLNDISSQGFGGLNFILDSANVRAREKDPGFDIRKSLIGNLGDDIITYEKAPRGKTPAELQSAPSLFLLGSPNPEALAAALKYLFVIFPQGDTVTEREFLGRKIFSVPLPPSPFPMGGASRPSEPRTLNCAAANGYVGLSTDAGILEEFVRSSEGQGKALRETAGLTEAAQKVSGPGTGLFGYQNQVETMRVSFESLRQDPGSATNAVGPTAANLLPGAFGVTTPDQAFKDLMDYSLLPPFDKVSKYFYFTVYGGSASVDGLTFKLFAPVPPPGK